MLTYDNIESHKKAGLHPHKNTIFENYRGVQIDPPQPF